jgi:hypothetical protein
LDGGPFQSGTSPHTFTNISGGFHFVTIKDNVGCSITINVNVSSGSGPSATAISSATSCNGAGDGTITVTAVNGTPPYSFSLDGALPVTGTSPFTFTNLASGIHTVVVIDAPGCFSNTVNLNVAPGPTLITTVTKPTATWHTTFSIFIKRDHLAKQ